MKKFIFNHAVLISAVIFLGSCEMLDDDIDKHVSDKDSTYIDLNEVAGILSEIRLNSAHLLEVHDAVTSSSSNGYDEEYTMSSLFSNPGAGVGDCDTKSQGRYEVPLRDLIKEHLYSGMSTKAAVSRPYSDPEAYLDALSSSDVQIYWPYSDEWDGEQMPIITFDPEDDSQKNIGYRLVFEDDGSEHVEEIVVDEELAKSVPVWVVNRNSDAEYTSLEMLRREDPNWGEGGGTIVVKPESKTPGISRALVLKDFTMNRNYDSWFAGASEFFVLTITGGCSFA